MSERRQAALVRSGEMMARIEGITGDLADGDVRRAAHVAQATKSAHDVTEAVHEVLTLGANLADEWSENASGLRLELGEISEKIGRVTLQIGRSQGRSHGLRHVIDARSRSIGTRLALMVALLAIVVLSTVIVGYLAR